MSIPQTNMAQKRSGLNPLSYMGVETSTPPQLLVQDRPPTRNDKDNVNIGAIWVYNDRSVIPWYPYVWMLTNLFNASATWTPLGAGTGEVGYFKTEDGNYTYPDPNGEMDIVGDGLNIKTTSDPLVPGRIKVEYVGTPGEIFQTNTGAATPRVSNQTLNILGGNNIGTRSSTSGVPPEADTIFFDLNDSIYVAGSIQAGNGLTVTAGGMDITGDVYYESLLATPGMAQIDGTGLLVTSTGTAGQLPTANSTGGIVWRNLVQGAGSVTISNDPVTGEITIGGGGGGGSGTISFATDVDSPVVPDGLGAISVLGKNILTTDGTTVNQIHVGLTKSTLGYVPMGNDTNEPVWGELIAGSGITITPGVGTITFTAGGGGTGGVIQLTGDTGAAAMDLSNNINVVGTTNQITTTGSSSTLTLALSSTLSLPGSLTIPSLTAGVLQSDGSGVITSSKGTDGQVLISSTAGSPAWAGLTAGTGISITPGANSITITNTSTSAGASIFRTNSGDATASGGMVRILGGENINTAGGTDTVTVNLNKNVLLPQTSNSGTTPPYQGVYGISDNATPAFPDDRVLHTYSGTAGSYRNNCFVGHGAGNFSLTTSSSTTCVGEDSGAALTTGIHNTFCGANCGNTVTSGGANCLYGSQTGSGITTASNNSLYGYSSGAGTLTGSDNSAYGYKSLYVATSATQNCIFGSTSGQALTTADGNCLFGYSAGGAITTSSNNVAIGLQAAASLISGTTENTCVGYQALALMDSTSSANSYSTAIGSKAVRNLQIGSYITAIGYEAGKGNLTGITSATSSIFLGATGLITDADHSIFIGNHGSSANQQDACYIAGIRGATPATTAQIVTIDSVNKLAPVAGTMSAGGIMLGTATGPSWGTITSTGGSIAVTNVGTTINLEQSSTYSFTAYLATSVPNVTGAITPVSEYTFGTTQTLVEEVDDGNNFYPGNGSGAAAKYTAPYTGFYTFCVSINYSYTIAAPPVVLARDPIYVKIYNSGGTLYRTYSFDYVLPTTAGTFNLNGQYTCYCKMTAGQYAQFSFSASVAATNIVSAGGGAGNTYFSGFLVSKL